MSFLDSVSSNILELFQQLTSAFSNNLSTPPADSRRTSCPDLTTNNATSAANNTKKSIRTYSVEIPQNINNSHYNVNNDSDLIPTRFRELQADASNNAQSKEYDSVTLSPVKPQIIVQDRRRNNNAKTNLDFNANKVTNNTTFEEHKIVTIQLNDQEYKISEDHNICSDDNKITSDTVKLKSENDLNTSNVDEIDFGAFENNEVLVNPTKARAKPKRNIKPTKVVLHHPSVIDNYGQSECLNGDENEIQFSESEHMKVNALASINTNLGNNLQSNLESVLAQRRKRDMSPQNMHTLTESIEPKRPISYNPVSSDRQPMMGMPGMLGVGNAVNLAELKKRAAEREAKQQISGSYENLKTTNERPRAFTGEESSSSIDTSKLSVRDKIKAMSNSCEQMRPKPPTVSPKPTKPTD